MTSQADQPKRDAGLVAAWANSRAVHSTYTAQKPDRKCKFTVLMLHTICGNAVVTAYGD